MKFLAALILLVATSIAQAEVVHLTDGTQVEGKLQKTETGWAVTQKNGTVLNLSTDRVASIELSQNAPTPSVAADRLISLRHVAAHLTNVQEIIDRYQKLIAQTADPDTLAEENKDLATWQDRLDRGLVKLGDQWVTPQERDVRRQSAQGEALSARDPITTYRYKDASKILTQALVDDPQNPTALFLQAIVLYKQEQVSQARKLFESVNQIVPGHAPSLNNLAVICWRQKSFVAAMNFYNQAMLAAPHVKEVLDNVAEALNALPEENRHAPVVRQSVALFAEQDADLQKIAAQQGMYRWGSSWVNAVQLQALKDAEAKIQAQLDDLQKQFNDLHDKIGQVDSQIQQNQVEMDRLTAQSTYTDRNGNTMQFPLPSVYYDLKSNNDKLAIQKTAYARQQDDLKNRGAQIRQNLPTPKFTGIQQIIGIEGAPVLAGTDAPPTTSPDAGPTSAPSTQSATNP